MQLFAAGLVADLVGHRRRVVLPERPVLEHRAVPRRARRFADAAGVALLHVVDPAPQHAAGPARRRLLDGVEHVAPCGVEVDREGQPAAVVVKFALEQVAHRAGFGLGEGTPVAIEVLAVDVAAPVALDHAVGIEQRQDDDQRPLAEVARQRRVGRQLVHETHPRLRAGGFRGMLPAEQPEHPARVWNAEHIGRASCRDRVWKYVQVWGVAVYYEQTTTETYTHN